MNMDNEKLKSVLEDKAFVEALSKMESNVEVQKAFAERGINFTVEEIDFIAEHLYGGEEGLDDAQLENVSGGIALETITVIVGGIALFGNVMTEVNNSRRARGKKPIW